MPILTLRNIRIDYTDEGHGQAVVLVHSSVSGNRQWRALTEGLSDRYRVCAVNLYGYGETTPWPGNKPQSLYAQAQLVPALCREMPGPPHLVGHSFGGAVALKAAGLLGERAGCLVLLEPNPFHLLQQAGRAEAYAEARALRDHVQCYGSLGDWPAVAERFADYWLGDGAWSAMPEKRRAAFVEALPPNIHEWDAVMDEQTPIGEWKLPSARTLVVSDPATRRPVREIVELFREACPHWSFRSVEGGHMAPLTRPDLINPIVRGFLDAGLSSGLD
ncbi:MAG: 2-hydroxy-6-oxo-6-(2-aminophenyl)hexa-2, 4-dienoic acid hydrolase [Betaproteobacteria bacterium]|nr:2-hydroxy-6-oxo-6-(2-aminophenyl)hexa-2, 4-dienoic acid hydrolase [Betaproteobacteria bacterium]